MLAHGQTETEDKTPTPEVSNYMLTPDNNLNPERSLDGTDVSSLRRRKVFTESNSCSTSRFSVSTNGSMVASDCYLSAGADSKLDKDRKAVKYPKATGTYPRLLQNNKIHPKDIKKIKKIDGRYIKPPSSQPPVFLKCKIKRKPCEDASVERSEDKDLSCSQTTDLDIQFSKVKPESLMASCSSLDSEGYSSVASAGKDQSLKQYCNFEEKKVMRVAPHIRRKDVICDTVDAWSYANDEQKAGESSQYKPLIFGGTYPIDLPVRSDDDNYLVRLANSISNEKRAGKRISKTYDIDIPTSCE